MCSAVGFVGRIKEESAAVRKSEIKSAGMVAEMAGDVQVGIGRNRGSNDMLVGAWFDVQVDSCDGTVGCRNVEPSLGAVSKRVDAIEDTASSDLFKRE